jgi:hypothetical protein
MDGVIEDGREAQQDMIWQGELMKTLTAWHKGKERKECWDQSGNASETRNTGREERRWCSRHQISAASSNADAAPDQTRRDALSEFGGDQGR